MLWWSMTVTAPPSEPLSGRTGGVGPGRPLAAPAAAGEAIGQDDLGLDVLGERLDLLDERPLRVGPGGVQSPLGAELGHVGREQRGHVDHRCLVLAVGPDREDLDDGLQRGGDHGVLDRVVGLGADGVIDVAEQDVLAADLPADDAVADRAAAVAVPGLGPLHLRDPEQVLAESLGRDLVKHLAVDPVDDEQAQVGLGLLGDDLVVGLDLGPLLPLGPWRRPWPPRPSPWPRSSAHPWARPGRRRPGRARVSRSVAWPDRR